MASYKTPVDVVRRALQILNSPHISSFSEGSAGAFEGSFSYDKIREFELQRNMWTFSTRRCILQPASTASADINFEAWAPSTSYPAGYVVSNGGYVWYSLTAGNLGNTPGTFPTDGSSLKWDFYFGPQMANPWSFANPLTPSASNTSRNSSYDTGDLVYKTPGNGTVKIYRSLVDQNQKQPDAVDAWSASTMYMAGAVVSLAGVNYQSLVDWNFNNTPNGITTQWTTVVTNPTVSGSWLNLAQATLSRTAITYPMLSGPLEDGMTRNAFRLPANFLKPCPDAPKEGQTPWLGGPTGVEQRDWAYEGQYIVSNTVTPIMVRFVANIIDVTRFHPMFSEGLSSAVALALPKALWGEGVSTNQIMRAFNQLMRDARIMNAIELSSITPPDDSYIAVRY